MDFGFNDPFVCLWIHRDAHDRIFVANEYVQSCRTVEENINEVKSLGAPPGTHIACDPSGVNRNDQTGRSNIDLLRKAGFIVHRQTSRIAEGLEPIRAALLSATGSVRLTIHPRCTRLITALKAYHYPDKGGENPVKDHIHDHPIDALRYYFLNYKVGSGTGSSAY
jgi:hypothetical protein